MSCSSFIVFYCVIIFLDTTSCPWIERLNPKLLVCNTQPTTVGPKDLVHNPLKQTLKPNQKSKLMIPGTHFITTGYQEKTGEIYISSKVRSEINTTSTHRFIVRDKLLCYLNARTRLYSLSLCSHTLQLFATPWHLF